ncbi:MAG: sarcosine oxidase subunit delta [Thermodesulfobacteriota bacterium]
MGFLLPCPNCGPRDVYEFKYGGEKKNQPGADAGLKEWRHYAYFNRNEAGIQEEWWYHQACDSWLFVRRDNTANRVLEAIRQEEHGGES